jgi:hypothetical protein
MSKRTVSRCRISGGTVIVTLEVDKTRLSNGDILTARAFFNQEKTIGLFVASECVIATPGGSPLEILDTEEKWIASKDDKGLSSKCEKTYRYFPILKGNAIVQASGVFISNGKKRHHVITDPLLIKAELTSRKRSGRQDSY